MGGAPYKTAKEGVGALSSVSAFNHKRAPTSCLQWLDAPKLDNGIKLSHQLPLNQVLTAHNTPMLCVAWGVRRIGYMSVYAKQPCNNHWWSFIPDFLPQVYNSARGCSSQTPRVCFVNHVKVTPGWVLICVFFGPKVGGWVLFHNFICTNFGVKLCRYIKDTFAFAYILFHACPCSPVEIRSGHFH